MVPSGNARKERAPAPARRRLRPSPTSRRPNMAAPADLAGTTGSTCRPGRQLRFQSRARGGHPPEPLPGRRKRPTTSWIAPTSTVTNWKARAEKNCKSSSIASGARATPRAAPSPSRRPRRPPPRRAAPPAAPRAARPAGGSWQDDAAESPRRRQRPTVSRAHVSRRAGRRVCGAAARSASLAWPSGPMVAQNSRGRGRSGAGRQGGGRRLSRCQGRAGPATRKAPAGAARGDLAVAAAEPAAVDSRQLPRERASGRPATRAGGCAPGQRQDQGGAGDRPRGDPTAWTTGTGRPSVPKPRPRRPWPAAGRPAGRRWCGWSRLRSRWPGRHLPGGDRSASSRPADSAPNVPGGVARPAHHVIGRVAAAQHRYGQRH